MSAHWNAFEPRVGLAFCGCVWLVGRRCYALRGCAACNGAGVVARAAVEAVAVEPAQKAVA